MKKLFTILIIGYICGILGALIFQPITTIQDILLSDFAIGGIVIGGIMSYRGFEHMPIAKKIIISILIGLIVFLCFGLLSGELVNDLIAGAFIGFSVGLMSQFSSKMLNSTVN